MEEGMYILLHFNTAACMNMSKQELILHVVHMHAC